MSILPVIGAIIMIWAVVTILVFMTYIGYDVRSRGISGKGWALTTLSANKIGINDYYKKKDKHPVLETEVENIASAKRFRMLTYLCLAVLVIIVVVFALMAVGVISM